MEFEKKVIFGMGLVFGLGLFTRLKRKEKEFNSKSLQDACRGGNFAKVQRLLSSPFKLPQSMADIHGQTPLMTAVKNNNLDLVDVLLQKLPDQVFERDFVGMTAAFHSITYADLSIVSALIHHPETDIDATNSVGETLLIKACSLHDENRAVDVTKRLLAKSPNMNIQDKNGLTALMKAIQKSYEKVAFLLIDSGLTIDFGLRSWERKTARNYAEQAQLQAVLKILPSPGPDAGRVNEQKQRDIISGSSAAPPSGSHDLPLPLPWEVAVHFESGRMCYFNPDTMETSWDKPRFEATPPSTSSQLPSPWEETVHYESNRKCYFNPVTMKTQWNRPRVESESLPLPSPWEEVVHFESQRICYFNPDSMETQWEKPREQPSELPSPWEEVVHFGSQRTCYFNPVSMKTQWERPHLEASSLPSPWEEVVDFESQRTCYFNPQSMKTQWERPRKAHTQPQLHSLPSSWEEVVDFESQRTCYFNTQSMKTQWERPHAEEILPSGWEKVLDVKTNRDCYFNSHTLQTQWYPPACPWEQVVHFESKKTYYFNESTMEIQSQKPNCFPSSSS